MTKRIDLCYFPKEKRRIINHTIAGISLKIYMADAVSAEWYDMDYPRREIDFLKLTKDDLVFDIGAHQGVIACVLAKLSGRVVAVESSFHQIPVIRINRTINKIKNMIPIHGLVCENGKKYNPLGVTVDELAEKYGIPTVLYMDIEGMEGMALRGAQKTLQSRPNLCIEMHMRGFGGTIFERGDTMETIFAAIPDGYRFFAAPHTDNCEVVDFSYEYIEDFDAFYLFGMKK